MIDYKKHDTLNLVELTIFGSITEDDFDRVTALLASDIQKHGKLRLLEEVRSFEGMDPITLWKDVQFSLQHINDFSHVAVVADAAWVRTFSSAMDNILAAQVQAFLGHFELVVFAVTDWSPERKFLGPFRDVFGPANRQVSGGVIK